MAPKRSARNQVVPEEDKVQEQLAALYEDLYIPDKALQGLRKTTWNRDFNGKEYGMCPICHERAVKITNFVNAHISVYGSGTDHSADNLRPICNTCYVKRPRQTDGYLMHLDDYEKKVMEKIRQMEAKGLLKILPLDYTHVPSTPPVAARSTLPPIHNRHHQPQQSVVPPTHEGLGVAHLFRPTPMPPAQQEAPSSTSSEVGSDSDSECEAPQTPNTRTIDDVHDESNVQVPVAETTETTNTHAQQNIITSPNVIQPAHVQTTVQAQNTPETVKTPCNKWWSRCFGF